MDRSLSSLCCTHMKERKACVGWKPSSCLHETALLYILSFLLSSFIPLLNPAANVCE